MLVQSQMMAQISKCENDCKQIKTLNTEKGRSYYLKEGHCGPRSPTRENLC